MQAADCTSRTRLLDLSAVYIAVAITASTGYNTQAHDKHNSIGLLI